MATPPDLSANPGPAAAAAPATRQPGAPGRRAVRVGAGLLRLILVALAVNAAANLVTAGGPRCTAGMLFDELVHGRLTAILFQPASLPGAVAVLRTWSLGAAGLWAVSLALVISAALWLRWGALTGLGLALGLLLLTLRSTGADLWSDLAGSRPVWLGLAVGLYGLVILLTVIRWRLLLRVQGIDLPLGSLTRLSLIGVFFNLAIPGAVSGDLVKMGYLAAHTPDRQAEGVLSILVDRVIGTLGLFVVAVVAVLSSLPLLLHLEARYQPLKVAAATVALGSLGGVVGVLLVEWRAALVRQPAIARLIALGSSWLPARARDLIARLIAALELYRGARPTIARTLLLAILVHALLALTLWTVGQAIGETRLHLHHYLVTTSIANAVAAIPATPGGVGMRDKITAAFLGAFGAAPAGKAGSIPVVLSLVIVFWAFVGAAVFIATGHGAAASRRPRS